LDRLKVEILKETVNAKGQGPKYRINLNVKTLVLLFGFILGGNFLTDNPGEIIKND